MLDLGMDFGVTNADTREVKVLKHTTVHSLLSRFTSGIGLDKSKNGTGISIWNGSEVEHYGFGLEIDYDKADPLSEIKMRREFRDKLIPIVKGKHFEVAIVEDVFGGKSFDTTRKLLALNTVFDELILDGVCTVGEFYKWENTLWKKYFRKICKIKGYPDDKTEIQKIFEYLQYPYYMTQINSESRDKQFQDKLDSLGMLCALSVFKGEGGKIPKKKLRLTQVIVKPFGTFEEVMYAGDKVLSDSIAHEADIKGNVKDGILRTLTDAEPDKVFYTIQDNACLGTLALELDLELSPYGSTILYFYRKKRK